MLMKNCGFTLVELMITIAIGAILLTLAVPGFQNIISQNRLATEANEIVTALNLARSEAVKRGANVVITPSGGDWANGWAITTVDPTLGLITLKEGDGVSGSLGLTGGPANFTMLSTGLRSDITPVTFTLCDASRPGERGRQIGVSPAGRPRIESDFTCP